LYAYRVTTAYSQQRPSSVSPVVEAENLPVVLSVDEAAAFLRIGRTCAYELARRYENTGGAEGLPVVRLGRLLRVPRAGLLRLLELPEPLA
jgi:transposase